MESIHIMFLIAALNDLGILGPDVQNKYIKAKIRKGLYHHWTRVWRRSRNTSFDSKGIIWVEEFWHPMARSSSIHLRGIGIQKFQR
jgi:hypothetical protein